MARGILCYLSRLIVDGRLILQDPEFASTAPEHENLLHQLLQDCHHPTPTGTASNYLDGEAGNLETKGLG
jgi:hypothetical protein